MGSGDHLLRAGYTSCSIKGRAKAALPYLMHYCWSVRICSILSQAPLTDARTPADAFGRILSGTVKPGDRVRVLGEAYTPEDEEDSAVAEVSNVWVYQARYRIPLTKALAGVLSPFATANRLPFACTLEEMLSLTRCFPLGGRARLPRQIEPNLTGPTLHGNI